MLRNVEQIYAPVHLLHTNVPATPEYISSNINVITEIRNAISIFAFGKPVLT